MREFHPDLRRLHDEATYAAISMSREEARKLFDAIDVFEEDDLLAYDIDSAQGDCTDGQPRYIILEVCGS